MKIIVLFTGIIFLHLNLTLAFPYAKENVQNTGGVEAYTGPVASSTYTNNAQTWPAYATASSTSYSNGNQVSSTSSTSKTDLSNANWYTNNAAVANNANPSWQPPVSTATSQTNTPWTYNTNYNKGINSQTATASHSYGGNNYATAGSTNAYASSWNNGNYGTQNMEYPYNKNSGYNQGYATPGYQTNTMSDGGYKNQVAPSYQGWSTNVAGSTASSVQTTNSGLIQGNNVDYSTAASTASAYQGWSQDQSTSSSTAVAQSTSSAVTNTAYNPQQVLTQGFPDAAPTDEEEVYEVWHEDGSIEYIKSYEEMLQKYPDYVLLSNPEVMPQAQKFANNGPTNSNSNLPITSYDTVLSASTNTLSQLQPIANTGLVQNSFTDITQTTSSKLPSTATPQSLTNTAPALQAKAPITASSIAQAPASSTVKYPKPTNDNDNLNYSIKPKAEHIGSSTSSPQTFKSSETNYNSNKKETMLTITDASTTPIESAHKQTIQPASVSTTELKGNSFTNTIQSPPERKLTENNNNLPGTVKPTQKPTPHPYNKVPVAQTNSLNSGDATLINKLDKTETQLPESNLGTKTPKENNDYLKNTSPIKENKTIPDIFNKLNTITPTTTTSSNLSENQTNNCVTLTQIEQKSKTNENVLPYTENIEIHKNVDTVDNSDFKSEVNKPNVDSITPTMTTNSNLSENEKSDSIITTPTGENSKTDEKILPHTKNEIKEKSVNTIESSDSSDQPVSVWETDVDTNEFGINQELDTLEKEFIEFAKKNPKISTYEIDEDVTQSESDKNRKNSSSKESKQHTIASNQDSIENKTQEHLKNNDKNLSNISEESKEETIASIQNSKDEKDQKHETLTNSSIEKTQEDKINSDQNSNNSESKTQSVNKIQKEFKNLSNNKVQKSKDDTNESEKSQEDIKTKTKDSTSTDKFKVDSPSETQIENAEEINDEDFETADSMIPDDSEKNENLTSKKTSRGDEIESQTDEEEINESENLTKNSTGKSVKESASETQTENVEEVKHENVNKSLSSQAEEESQTESKNLASSSKDISDKSQFENAEEVNGKDLNEIDETEKLDKQFNGAEKSQEDISESELEQRKTSTDDSNDSLIENAGREKGKEENNKNLKNSNIENPEGGTNKSVIPQKETKSKSENLSNSSTDESEMDSIYETQIENIEEVNDTKTNESQSQQKEVQTKSENLTTSNTDDFETTSTSKNQTEETNIEETIETDEKNSQDKSENSNNMEISDDFINESQLLEEKIKTDQENINKTSLNKIKKEEIKTESENLSIDSTEKSVIDTTSETEIENSENGYINKPTQQYYVYTEFESTSSSEKSESDNESNNSESIKKNLSDVTSKSSKIGTVTAENENVSFVETKTIESDNEVEEINKEEKFGVEDKITDETKISEFYANGEANTSELEVAEEANEDVDVTADHIIEMLQNSNGKKPLVWFKTSDTEVLQKLLNEDGWDYIYFFNIKSSDEETT